MFFINTFCILLINKKIYIILKLHIYMYIYIHANGVGEELGKYVGNLRINYETRQIYGIHLHYTTIG